ncbi:YegS/Rv2252/BmrU family lipid kinase [uncultured Desulfobacter sp.]|uniref:YegS/Rv2252/BmrU family lipid kinase n=1 Tax=uncultured Desulfobacter sp. TaxID=240139 RepID=UPI0029F5911A|nr:YegS/Rv2252/BmrU family lipid kinase [uncultured Desulfobacter sp.]
MKVLLIGNPISSGGDTYKRIEILCDILQKGGHEVTTYLTRYAGDGKAHAFSLSRGIDRMVVVGGDGTLNEIINGLPADSSCPILHFPTGNANLLARDLKLPQKTAAIADLVEQGRIIQADTAVMNTHRFVMVAGIGFDARVTEELKKVRSGKINNLSYVRPIIRAAKTRTSHPLFVSIDNGVIKAKAAAVLVSNVKNYAGVCEMAYDAGICNGLLDVIIFPRENLLAMLSYLICARFKNITKIKDVIYVKAQKSILVQSEEPLPVQLDGDFHGRHHEVFIRNQPGTLRLIVPDGFIK